MDCSIATDCSIECVDGMCEEDGLPRPSLSNDELVLAYALFRSLVLRHRRRALG